MVFNRIDWGKPMGRGDIEDELSDLQTSFSTMVHYVDSLNEEIEDLKNQIKILKSGGKNGGNVK